jgi:glucose dehydrogenase
MAYSNGVIYADTGNLGTVVAINANTGKSVKRTNTTIDAWVQSNNTATNTSMNGGADPWSGEAIDAQKGVAYLPYGNASPNFDVSTRPRAQLYA